MDEKLKEIFKIRPLQTECIAYRSFTNEYRSMLKRACVAELKNLLSVEMKIEQVHLEMPNDEQIPKIMGEIKTSKVDNLLKECSIIQEGLQLL